jgi:NAD(P)-dependent dehydrogenase (short-subunit alcohol dehydrogenase family)
MSEGHAIVTGAGTGIGRAIALRVARDGAAVTLLSIAREELEETAGLIEGPSHVAPCDIRDRVAVDAAMADATSALGPVHALVAVSGIGGGNGEDDDRGDRFDDLVRTNLSGTYYCVRAALRHPPGTSSSSRPSSPGSVSRDTRATARRRPGCSDWCGRSPPSLLPTASR